MAHARPQHHPSSLAAYSMCAYRWYLRYVKRLPWIPSVSMIIGSATDASVTGNLNSRIVTGQPLGPNEVRDIARDALNVKWDEGVYIGEEDDEPQTKGKAVDESVDFAALHAQSVAPTIQPVAVQWSWCLDISGTNESLTGTADILEPIPIRDTKTTRRSYAQDAAHSSTQLTAYAMARSILDPTMPDVIPVALDVLVRQVRGIKVQRLTSVRTQADYLTYRERMAAILAGIHAGHFPPCDRVAWWCSPKQCRYFDQCKYVRNPHSVMV
jgi:hypothetical protein